MSEISTRRRRGRPRKTLPGPDPDPASTRLSVKDRVQEVIGTRLSVAPIEPRLLDLPGSAAYLSVSGWTVRELEAAGILRRVRVPASGSRDLRKILFDREDLDALIASWKEATSP